MSKMHIFSLLNGSDTTNRNPGASSGIGQSGPLGQDRLVGPASGLPVQPATLVVPPPHPVSLRQRSQAFRINDIISFSSAHELRIHPDLQGASGKDRHIRLVRGLQKGKTRVVWEGVWTDMSDGMWRPTPGEPPVAVKIQKLIIDDKEMDLKTEFDHTLSIHESTWDADDETENTIRPLMAGRVVKQTGAGNQTTTEYEALVTPLHEPLEQYLQRVIDSLFYTGLILVRLHYSLYTIHKANWQHGDVKAGNVVVPQIFNDGQITSSNRAVIIDCGTSFERKPGFRQVCFSGTPGYMSQAMLSMYVHTKWRGKGSAEKKYLSAWNRFGVPDDLQFFLQESIMGCHPADENFGVGCCLIEALVDHKRHATGITTPFSLTSRDDYSDLKDFFDASAPPKPWEELSTIIKRINLRFREVWESREYETFLGPEYAIFFPFIKDLLKKPFFNESDSASVRRSDATKTIGVIRDELGSALQVLKQREVAAGVEVGKLAVVIPPKSSTATASKGSFKAWAHTATTKISTEAPSRDSNPTPSLSSTATDSSSEYSDEPADADGSTPGTHARTNLSSVVDPASSSTVLRPDISAADIYRLSCGNLEPIESRRLRATKLKATEVVFSWGNQGLSIQTLKGNWLVPQRDGGYANEVWIRLGPSGKVVIDPDLGCGRKHFICALPGCHKRYVTHEADEIKKHYIAKNEKHLKKICVAGQLHFQEHGRYLELDARNGDDWHFPRA